jgi:uncharacterized protein
VLATAAAPTYFPSKQLGKDNLIDGGLIANAPDVIALAESLRQFQDINRTYMLSVGTCGESLARPFEKNIRSGGLWWIARRKLLHLTMAAQERLAVQTAKSLLGPRHIRLDGDASSDEQRALGLDKTDPQASAVLEALASRIFSDLNGSERQLLGDIFRHRPREQRP